MTFVWQPSSLFSNYNDKIQFLTWRSIWTCRFILLYFCLSYALLLLHGSIITCLVPLKDLPVVYIAKCILYIFQLLVICLKCWLTKLRHLINFWSSYLFLVMIQLSRSLFVTWYQSSRFRSIHHSSLSCAGPSLLLRGWPRWSYIFLVFFYSYHYNFRSLERHHYYSPILKRTITIICFPQECQRIHIGTTWAQLQTYTTTCILVWTKMPSAPYPQQPLSCTQ